MKFQVLQKIVCCDNSLPAPALCSGEWSPFQSTQHKASDEHVQRRVGRSGWWQKKPLVSYPQTDRSHTFCKRPVGSRSWSCRGVSRVYLETWQQVIKQLSQESVREGGSRPSRLATGPCPWVCGEVWSQGWQEQLVLQWC